MGTMFLESDEVQDLTNRVQHAAQARALRSMGIEHKPRPDGSLAVLRSHVETVLSGGKESSRRRAEPEINWSGVNATRT